MVKRWTILLLVVIVQLASPVVTSHAEAVTIRYSSWLAASHQEVEKGIIAEFEAAFPEIKVEYEYYPPSEYQQKVVTMMAGGSAPDVQLLSWADAPSLAQQELYLDLTPYIERDAIDLSRYFAPLVNHYREGPILYGVPRAADTSIVFYNVERFREQGLVDPNELHDRGEWNWDTLLEAAKKLTRDRTGDGTIDEYGTSHLFWNTLDRGYGLWPALNGMDLFDPARTRTYLDSEASVEAFQWWSDLVHVHGVAGGTRLADFSAGLHNIVVNGGTWRVSDYRTAIGDEFEWDIVPWPQGPRGGRYSGITTGLALGIWKDAPAKEEAWEFIKFYTGYESQTRIVTAGSGIAAYVDANRIPNVFVDGTIRHGHKVMDVFEKSTDPWLSGVKNPTAINQAIVSHLGPVFQGSELIPARQGAELAAEAVNRLLNEN